MCQNWKSVQQFPSSWRVDASKWSLGRKYDFAVKNQSFSTIRVLTFGKN